MPKISALPEDTALATADELVFVDDSDGETTKISGANLRDAFKDGGGLEVDAAELAAGQGTANQFLQTDGAAASWATPSSSDLSDFDEAAQDAVGNNFDASLSYDDATPQFGVATDGIGTDELDQTIAPTLTGTWTFNGGIVGNEDAGTDDFRWESADSQNMLHVHGASSPSGSQVSIHADVNNDWGALWVGARDASGAVDVDMVATLGDKNESATVDANNAEVWQVSARGITLNAGSATTITDAGTLYVDGPPVAGTNVTITNQYLGLFHDSLDNTVLSVKEDGTVNFEQGDLTDGTNTVYNQSASRIGNDRVDENSIASGAIGDGLSGGSGTVLSVNESQVDHDSLNQFVANEHIDWTADQGTTNIDANNFPHDHTETALSTVPNAGLTNDSVTVAGKTVALGGSATVAAEDLSNVDVTTPSAGQLLIYHGTNSQFETVGITAGSGVAKTEGDASLTLSADEANIDHDNLQNYVANEHLDWTADQGATDIDQGNYPHDHSGGTLSTVPNAGLTNDTVTVAGNAVALGNTTTVAAGDLSDVDVTTPSAGQLLIYHATNGQFETVSATGGDGVAMTEADASLTFAVDIVASGGLQFTSGELGVDEANVDHDSLSGFVANEHIDHSGVTISSGTGLSGGGDITASRTLSLDAATSDLNDAASPNATAAGQLLIWDATDSQFENATLTAGNATTITNADASVTIATDASALAGTLLTENAGALDVQEGSIDHDALTNFVANEHVDHSTVSISSGTGLSGGGDITAPRTLSFDESYAATITSAWAWDTGAGANLQVDETGVYYSTANAETLNFRNTGTGSVTVQQDGTAVVLETRSLTGGNGIQAIGDLSADRTVAVAPADFTGSGLTTSGTPANIDVGAGTGITVNASDVELDSTVLVDGGAKELDVADLAGGSGTSGQVPQSDGAAVTWVTLASGDLSDFDEAAQDAVGNNFDATLTYDDAAPSFGVDLTNPNSWSGLQTFNGTLAVGQLGADPTTSANESHFFVSDGTADATGSASDLVMSVNDGTTERLAVLYDHSAAGIPNSTLVNSSVTYSSGDGLTGGGAVALGSSATFNVRLDFEDGGTDVTTGYGINFGSNLSVTDDGDNTITVDATSSGSAITVQEDGTNLTTDVSLFDFQTGITATEPTADEIDLNLDESVLKDGGALEIDVAEFAGALGTSGQVPQSDGAAVTWVTLASGDLSDFDEAAQDAVGNNYDSTLSYDDATPSFGINLGNANTWTGLQTFNGTAAFGQLGADPTTGSNESHLYVSDGTADVTGDASDLIMTANDGTTEKFAVLFDHSGGGVPNSALVNSQVTYTAGTGLSGGGAVSLGGSATINLSASLSDLSDVGTTSATDGHVIASDGTDFDSEAITSVTGAHVSLSDLSDVGTTTATDGHVIASDGTDFDSEGIASVASAHLSVDDLSDVASATESAGDVLIWHGTNSQYENSPLTGGDGISVTNADASVTLAAVAGDLAGSGLTTSGSPADLDVGAGTAITVNASDVQVTAGGITTTEIDTSIAPTWTGIHEHQADLNFTSNSTLDHDLQTVSTNTTTDGTGYWLVDSSGGAVTLTIASADASGAREINVKRSGSNTVTIATEGAETIDGSTTLGLTNDNESVTLVWDSANSDWKVY